LPEDEFIYDREDKESQLLEKLRNLSITPSDDGCVGNQPEKMKSYHDDQAEHSKGVGDTEQRRQRGAQE
jgi:hypothetical protein